VVQDPESRVLAEKRAGRIIRARRGTVNLLRDGIPVIWLALTFRRELPKLPSIPLDVVIRKATPRGRTGVI
jgi:hypothetical protein